MAGWVEGKLSKSGGALLNCARRLWLVVTLVASRRFGDA
jgi:hypothetical protein